MKQHDIPDELQATFSKVYQLLTLMGGTPMDMVKRNKDTPWWDDKEFYYRWIIVDHFEEVNTEVNLYSDNSEEVYLMIDIPDVIEGMGYVKAPLEHWIAEQVIDDKQLLNVVKLSDETPIDAGVSTRGPGASHTPEGYELHDIPENEYDTYLLDEYQS